MSAKALERVFVPGWRKKLDAIRWKAQNDAAESRKRTNQRLRHRAAHPTDSDQQENKP